MSIELPTQGESGSTWPSKLLSFLEVEHEADGTHKQNNGATTGIGLKLYTGGAVFPEGQVTTAVTLQDLDLSSIVGANTALCIFEVVTGGATGTNQVVFVTKGATGAYAAWALAASSDGFNKMYVTGTGSRGYMACLTDSSGVVQWGATTKHANNLITIYLRAYIL